MTAPDPDRRMSDDDLMDLVALALDEEEGPLPAGAVDFATGAFVWRDMEGDLAALLHDSALEEAVVLRDETCLRLLVFQAGSITLDVEHARDGLAGAVSPPARYRVEVHNADQHASGTAVIGVLADESGMFEVKGPIQGSIRFVVREPGGGVAIITPWITL